MIHYGPNSGIKNKPIKDRGNFCMAHPEIRSFQRSLFPLFRLALHPDSIYHSARDLETKNGYILAPFSSSSQQSEWMTTTEQPTIQGSRKLQSRDSRDRRSQGIQIIWGIRLFSYRNSRKIPRFRIRGIEEKLSCKNSRGCKQGTFTQIFRMRVPQTRGTMTNTCSERWANARS